MPFGRVCAACDLGTTTAPLLKTPLAAPFVPDVQRRLYFITAREQTYATGPGWAAIDRGNLPRKASSSTNAKPSYLGRICSTRRLAGCCCCCCAPLLVAFPRTAATSPSPSAPPTFMGRSATPPTFTAMRSQRCAHQHTRLQGCCPACELPRLAGTAGRTRGRLMPPPPPAPPRPQM